MRTGPESPVRADRRGGFTLLELLVVLVILGLLVAILALPLARALRHARLLQCQSNLRAIGAAYAQYLADAGGVWPPILTSEVPAAAIEQVQAETGLAMAPPRPAADWGQPGPHWSIVLWPHIRSLETYTCPVDPKVDLRGVAVHGPAKAHSVALLDAPPESYALNVILFRTADDLRRQAGCTWGTKGDADYNGLQSCTTQAEQRRQFPQWPRVILFFCGASGQTVGSQFNIPFRTSGLVERWEWHPEPASAAFADDPDTGSNYLFADGRVEYRDALPGPAEWGYDLGPRPQP